jgi:hypothetical protein
MAAWLRCQGFYDDEGGQKFPIQQQEFALPLSYVRKHHESIFSLLLKTFLKHKNKYSLRPTNNFLNRITAKVGGILSS